VREIPIGSFQIVVTAVVLVVTALVLVRWKPSARSRSLSDISVLSAPPARIGVAEATPLRRDPASRVVPPRSASGASRHARLALPVRQGTQSVGVSHRTFTVEPACATYFFLAD